VKPSATGNHFVGATIWMAGDAALVGGRADSPSRQRFTETM
jgi:hypothetical protein